MKKNSSYSQNDTIYTVVRPIRFDEIGLPRLHQLVSWIDVNGLCRTKKIGISRSAMQKKAKIRSILLKPADQLDSTIPETMTIKVFNEIVTINTRRPVVVPLPVPSPDDNIKMSTPPPPIISDEIEFLNTADQTNDNENLTTSRTKGIHCSSPIHEKSLSEPNNEEELYDPFSITFDNIILPCDTELPTPMPPKIALPTIRLKHGYQKHVTLEDSIAIRIIDEGHSTRAILKNNIGLLENGLMTAIDQSLSKKECPRFFWTGIENEHFKMICADPFTLTWLEQSIRTMNNLWENADLRIIYDNYECQAMHKAKVWIPGPKDNIATVLYRLKIQNGGIIIERMNIYKIMKGFTNGQCLIVGVDNSTYKVLQSNKFEAYYGFNKVYFDFNKFRKAQPPKFIKKKIQKRI